MAMFRLLIRDGDQGKMRSAPRPASSRGPRPDGLRATDTAELRSSSPWFGRHRPGPVARRSESARPTVAVVVPVGGRTDREWRHAAVQLR